MLDAGKQQKKSKKRKLLACIAVPETAACADGAPAAASPTKKRKKEKKKTLETEQRSTAPAPSQPESLLVPVANGVVANGLADGARTGGVTADAAGKKRKKQKKSKEGKVGPVAAAPIADTVSVQPVAEAEPAAAELREKPEPVLEDAVPDPEPLKGDDASHRQQQPQGAPGSGRAFQRVKAEEWLNKKVRNPCRVWALRRALHDLSGMIDHTPHSQSGL